MLGAWLFGFCCAWVVICVVITPPGWEDLTTTPGDFFTYMAGALSRPIRIIAGAS